jgi:tetratricopeptide (TPR) repeat protein
MAASSEFTMKSYRSLYFDEREDYRDFIDQLSEHLLLNPNTHAYNNIGVAYYEIGKKKKAYEYLSQAIQLDHTNDIAYINRAELNQKLKNTKEALHDFGKSN